MLRNTIAVGVMLLFVTCSLFARYSAGVEVTPLLSIGIVGGYEGDQFRGELALHLFPSDYLQVLTFDGGDQYVYEPRFVCKTAVAGRFLSWRNQALYAGAGMFGYIDVHSANWMVAAGPALRYAWKFPSRQMELSLDFLFPLLFKDNYEHDPNDDFPSEGSFVALMLILIAPSIGISWTF